MEEALHPRNGNCSHVSMTELFPAWPKRPLRGSAEFRVYGILAAIRLNRRETDKAGNPGTRAIWDAASSEEEKTKSAASPARSNSTPGETASRCCSSDFSGTESFSESCIEFLCLTKGPHDGKADIKFAIVAPSIARDAEFCELVRGSGRARRCRRSECRMELKLRSRGAKGVGDRKSARIGEPF